MGDLLSQINFFRMEILALLDQGVSISIDELEKIHDNGDIVDYIGDHYKFKFINSTPDNQNLLKEKLSELYISVGDAQKYLIENNGLIYLLHILCEIFSSEAHDYLFMLKDLLSADKSSEDNM